MKITIEKPSIISILYQQEREDPDYGSCLWARFYFDINNYTLNIESDCGNYGYGWVPTPNSESFLRLCARFNDEYLLEKIARRTVVNGDETWAALKELLEDIDDADNEEDRHFDMETIESACYHNCNETEAHECIVGAIQETFFSGKLEDYEIWQCIDKDYPANAKKIVSVFDAYIKPQLKVILKEEIEG